MSIGWQAASPFVDTPFPDHLPKDCFSKSKEKLQLIGTESDESEDDHPTQEPPFTPTNTSPYKRAEKRQSKSRHDRTRFRTTPVTFEEIAEVDEEISSTSSNHTDNNRRGGGFSDQNSNSYLHKDDTWHFFTKDDLLQPSPRKRLASVPNWFGYNALFPRESAESDEAGNELKKYHLFHPVLRHHRSHDMLTAQHHKLSLPPIPEATSPGVQPNPPIFVQETGFEIT